MNCLTKLLFRLSVITFIVAMLMPVTTAGKEFDCERHGQDHPNCQGVPPEPEPDPPPPPADTFFVEVSFNGSPIGSAGGAEGKKKGQRRNVSLPDITLNLSSLDAALVANSCDFDSDLTGQRAMFALGTYQNHQNGAFTFVTADFWNFSPDDTDVNYALVIGTPGDGDLLNLANGWLPGVNLTTRVEGSRVGFVVQTGADVDPDCNVEIGMPWTIDVTGEP